MFPRVEKKFPWKSNLIFFQNRKFSKIVSLSLKNRKFEKLSKVSRVPVGSPQNRFGGVGSDAGVPRAFLIHFVPSKTSRQLDSRTL